MLPRVTTKDHCCSLTELGLSRDETHLFLSPVLLDASSELRQYGYSPGVPLLGMFSLSRPLPCRQFTLIFRVGGFLASRLLASFGVLWRPLARPASSLAESALCLQRVRCPERATASGAGPAGVPFFLECKGGRLSRGTKRHEGNEQEGARESSAHGRRRRENGPTRQHGLVYPPASKDGPACQQA